MYRWLALVVPLAALWLASLYGAYRLGRDAGYPGAAVPEYTDCHSVLIFNPAGMAELAALESSGYVVTRSDPLESMRGRLVTACR